MLTKEKAHEAAEKTLKYRNKSEFVAGGEIENELKYYEWYFMRHGDETDTWNAQVGAMNGNEMYQFALENPVENEEFDQVFGKASPEVEAKAFYKVAVKNYFINYYKYSEDGFCDEGKISKTFDDVWFAAEDMIRDTMQHYSVDKMAKQLRRLAELARDAAYEARMDERNHAEMLDSMGWVRTGKPATMTAAQFVDRYHPRHDKIFNRIRIPGINYDRDERDAIKHYIGEHREEIVAVINERKRIHEEVHKMYEELAK